MSNSRDEAYERLEAAKVHLDEAYKAHERGSFFVSGRESQLCIENSAKAIISCFELPEWDHIPKDQLEEILDSYKIDEKWIDGLRRIGDFSLEAYPAHIEANYGVKKNGRYLSPREVFDERRSKDLLSKADYSYKNAKGFVDEYFG